MSTSTSAANRQTSMGESLLRDNTRQAEPREEKHDDDNNHSVGDDDDDDDDDDQSKHSTSSSFCSSSFYDSSSSYSDFDLNAPRPRPATASIDAHATNDSPSRTTITEQDKKSGLYLSLEMVQMLRTATSEGDVVALNNLHQQVKKMTPARRNSGGGSSTPRSSRMVFALQTKSCMESSHPAIDANIPKPKETFEQILREQLGMDVKYHDYSQLPSDFFVKGCVSSHSFELMKAIRQNDIAILRQHHAVGWNLQCCNKFGETIVHAAARRGLTDILKYLSGVADVSMRVCCDGGRTPLHDACWTGRPDFATIRFLLQDCPDFLCIKDQRGFTPLDFIPKEAHEEWNVFLNQHPELLIPRELV